MTVEASKSDALRGKFSSALSRLYRGEAPLYGDLLDIVEAVNAGAPDDAQHDARRIGSERHGAIRVGSPSELAELTRVFAVLGMVPVDYYDLAPAGLPVHSTAFRPVGRASLDAAPFRIFTSLLRIDLLPVEIQGLVEGLLARRQVVSPALMRLTRRFEAHGVLSDAEEDEFIEEAVATFRWRGDILVEAETYHALREAHPLISDIVAFAGPHLNHLTPRTIDIDAAQAAMRERGLPAKKDIEGPPRRAAPLLLRQTAFKALDEQVRTPSGETLRHTARFGEIEQRGAALSRVGRALYDGILEKHGGADPEAFDVFPDDFAALRRQGLVLFEYRLVDRGAAEAAGAVDLEALIDVGAVAADPITYEDFLPVSAAGIFRSNLGVSPDAPRESSPARGAFENALGRPVLESHALYEDQVENSLRALSAALGYDLRTVGPRHVAGGAR